MRFTVCLLVFLPAWLLLLGADPPRPRAREFGIKTGVLPPGPGNAITDVSGVQVGQVTLVEGDSVRTGVTAVIPHPGNLFQEKLPAAIAVGNGFGKLAGYTQVEELGTLETPVVLTNTLSVPVAVDALIEYTLVQAGNEDVQSVNAVVGETNDGYLSDIRGRHVRREHVLEALRKAANGPVEEGAIGAGTGTMCFGFKGGIGTASRKLPQSTGGYTVGVLVQTNFGGILNIGGVPIGTELGDFFMKRELQEKDDGSCMVVVATDAPLDSRNLKRLARRALLGIARTGGFYANGSGDYAIAFSTARDVRVPNRLSTATQTVNLLRDDRVSPLFLAAAEATEEAILNSLFKAVRVTGRKGHVAEALPLERLRHLLGDRLEK